MIRCRNSIIKANSDIMVVIWYGASLDQFVTLHDMNDRTKYRASAERSDTSKNHVQDSEII